MKQLGKGAFGPFLSCGKRLLCCLSFMGGWVAGWLASWLFFSLFETFFYLPKRKEVLMISTVSKNVGALFYLLGQGSCCPRQRGGGYLSKDTRKRATGKGKYKIK